MKIKAFMAMAIALVSLTMVSTSCSKDEKETPAADELVGTYTGTLDMTVMGIESSDEASYIITKVDDNTINLTIPAAGSGSMSLPTITAENIPAVKTKVNGVEVVEASAATLAGSVTVNGAEKTYSFTDLVILTSGTNTISINYSLKYGKMPADMVCSFKGTRN